ncbi:MAG: toll/interleukin-1 receptor domain-containing protein [Clostridia bacterium]|nr:toll/interleukin-1 receptor domain-containing protein [Clostridia bacterium]
MNETERLTEFKEHHWDMLLDYIGQGRVVPVIGPELLVAAEDGRNVPFYQAVSKRLACHFDMPEVEGETLSDLLARFLRGNNTVKMARTGLIKVLKELEDQPQPSLRRLASVTAFRLFLTTTPDALLARALAASGTDPDVYFFSTNYRRRSDLPDKKLLGRQRYVYHLYGKAAPCFEYAMSDDDRLLFSCEWLDSQVKPRNLLSYLADKYLLILGCGYENWQARFFLFGLKGSGLFSNIWDASSLLADSHTRTDSQLDRFLSRCRGNIYYEGGAAEFVDELCGRLDNTPLSVPESECDAFEKGSIFISYASEDREAALKVKRRLEALSLPVWLDQHMLESGADYDELIENNIRNSSLFLPILSRTTARETGPRYFRKEWNIAADQALRSSPKIPFIHPIAIDDVEPCDGILDAVNRVHWIHAAGGELQESDIDRLIDLVAQL